MSRSIKSPARSRFGAAAVVALTVFGACGFADAQVVRPQEGTGNPSQGGGSSGQFGGAGNGGSSFGGGGGGGPQYGGGGSRGPALGGGGNNRGGGQFGGAGGGFGRGDSRPNFSDGNKPRPFSSPGYSGGGRGLNGNRYRDGRGFGFNNRGDYGRRGYRFNRYDGLALGGLGLGYGLGSSGYDDGGYDAPYGYGSDFDGIGPGSPYGTTFYGPGSGATALPGGYDQGDSNVAGLPIGRDNVGQLGQSCRTPRKTCELISDAVVGGGCSCKGDRQTRLRGVVVE